MTVYCRGCDTYYEDGTYLFPGGICSICDYNRKNDKNWIPKKKSKNIEKREKDLVSSNTGLAKYIKKRK